MSSVAIDNLRKSALYTDVILFKGIILDERIVNVLERLFALFLIIVFFPIMLTVSLLIKLLMGGSIFYRQVRVGKNNKLFSIIKFRSMVDNAEAITGPILSSSNDPRVTTFGRFLRASHFDELPQLFNVIKGEMSFVGPRPERPEFVRVF